MLPIQPPFIPLFFKKNNTKNNSSYEKIFLSWEDALWQLLRNHQIPKDSVVLVPNFFCWDVVENMETHGLKHIVYEVDKYLQPNQIDFENKLKEFNPAIIIIFNAVGITNSLFKNIEWLRHLHKEAILIEDCVHKIIDREKISFITKNHYLIDSLRKVVPIQGSRVFSQQKIVNPSFTSNLSTAWYRTRVFYWWIVMQLALVLVYVSNNNFIQRYGNRLAEYAMKTGYNIIGDHANPSSAPRIMGLLAKKINIDLIKKIKEKQTNLYSDLLKNVFTKEVFFKIPFSNSDKKELRGFPLGIELAKANLFLNHIRSKGVLVRFELDDSLWANKQKVVYLPMGPQVSEKDIEMVCDVIKSF